MLVSLWPQSHGHPRGQECSALKYYSFSLDKIPVLQRGMPKWLTGTPSSGAVINT